MRHPEGVLLILGDEKLIPHLTMKQIGILCSCHPDLAIHLLNNLKSLLAKLSFIGINYLIVLSQKHLKVAKVIFDTPELCSLLNGYQIAQIGQSCFETAMYILDDPLLRCKLSPYDIAILGQALPEISYFILGDSKLTAQFAARHLIA